MTTRDGSSSKMDMFSRSMGFLILWGGVFLAGFLDRAPEVIWPLLVICCMAELAGRWGARRHAGDGSSKPMHPLKIIAITAVAVVGLYAIGRGAESLMDARAAALTLGFFDWLLSGVMLAVGAPLRVCGASFARFFSEPSAEEPS